MSFTFCRFFNLLRQRAISSRDSRAQMTQVVGGFKYLKNVVEKDLEGFTRKVLTRKVLIKKVLN